MTAGAEPVADPMADDTCPTHAFCDAVVLVRPVRRPTPSLNALAPQQAAQCLRRDWPIAELHPHRRPSRIAADLSRACRCWEVRLSPRRHDLLWLLDAAHANLPDATLQYHLREPIRRVS